MNTKYTQPRWIVPGLVALFVLVLLYKWFAMVIAILAGLTWFVRRHSHWSLARQNEIILKMWLGLGIFVLVGFFVFSTLLASYSSQEYVCSASQQEKARQILTPTTKPLTPQEEAEKRKKELEQKIKQEREYPEKITFKAGEISGRIKVLGTKAVENYQLTWTPGELRAVEDDRDTILKAIGELQNIKAIVKVEKKHDQIRDATRESAEIIQKLLIALTDGNSKQIQQYGKQLQEKAKFIEQKLQEILNEIDH